MRIVLPKLAVASGCVCLLLATSGWAQAGRGPMAGELGATAPANPASPDLGAILGSPVLRQLTSQALANSPDLGAAQARIEQARAQSDAVRAAAFPSLRFAVSLLGGNKGVGTTTSAAADGTYDAGLFG